MVFDQLKEVQDTFGKHVQNGAACAMVQSCWRLWTIVLPYRAFLSAPTFSPPSTVSALTFDAPSHLSDLTSHSAVACVATLMDGQGAILMPKCISTGLLASVPEKDLMEQVKTLLATRQKEHSSPSKVPTKACLASICSCRMWNIHFTGRICGCMPSANYRLYLFICADCFILGM